MSIASDSDRDVQVLVEDELAWSPDVNAARIGVSVVDGTVSLAGEVETYAERLAAKRAARRVRGVRAIVDNVTVHPKSKTPVTETDIAKEVKRALNAAANIPEAVQAEVDGHNVTLTGEVDWDYQRTAAKRAVQYLRGVYTVNSLMTLKSRPSAADAEERIRSALVRSAQLDAQGIHVQVDGGKVVLTGTVASWAERHQAANTAWSSPHVSDVDNRLIVRG